jgi:phosphocarrier protein
MHNDVFTDSIESQTPANPKNGAAVTRTFVLANRLGLHARPSAAIVKTLKHYESQVHVSCNGEIANARSILGLLSLAAGYNAKLTFTAMGPDATHAMQSLQHLFTSNFEEAYPC